MTQQKHSKNIANLPAKIVFFRFVDYAKILLCFCYVFALQQLILYFLIVFVANSLQIACISSFLQAICNKNHRKNEETQAICKLFATKTIKKYRISCCRAKTEQWHIKNIAKTQQTFQQKLHFLDFVDYAKILLCFCSVFAMSKHLLCSFAMYLLCSFAMSKHLLCSFAMYLPCSFAMSNICSAVLLCFCFAVLLFQNICLAVLVCQSIT